jgi:hypothetical protein
MIAPLLMVVLRPWLYLGFPRGLCPRAFLFLEVPL